MAKCINCEKSGLFLKVNQQNLCRSCQTEIDDAITYGKIKFDTAVYCAKNPGNALDAYLNIEEMRGILRSLEKYERKGIKTISPNPSALLLEIDQKYDSYFVNCFKTEYDELEEKVLSMKVKKAKIVRIEKFVMYLDKYKTYLHDPSSIDLIYRKTEILKNLA